MTELGRVLERLRGTLITEAGEEAGKLEIVKTDLKVAREFAEKIFADNNRDLNQEIPRFDSEYLNAQKLAGLGSTQRKDMPVIDIVQVREFQQRLVDGALDIVSDNKNPFPQGLSGKQAEQWLQDGLEPFDGDADDDKVKCKIQDVEIGKLKPIQKQIYFDKSISSTAQFGAKGTADFLSKKSILIASSDLFIIDGHYRWLSGNLIDRKLRVPVLLIDLPISTLLPLSLAYGDAIGNKRNM